MSLTNDLDQVDYFPIRILSEQTGVNSVTLRAWERRYGLLKPYRTEKGHRLYLPQDVERVKKILYWVHLGVPVGKVKSLLESNQDADLEVQHEDAWQAWQQQFMGAVIDLRQSKWEPMFREASKQYPASVLLMRGVLPVLEQLRNQSSRLVSRLALQSALSDVVISMTDLSGGNLLQSDALVINLDNCALMSRLLCWLKASSSEQFFCMDGVRSFADIVTLYDALTPKRLVFVAEDMSQVEAEKWLLQWSSVPCDVCFIGTGLWLASQASNDLDKPWRVFSDLAAYLN